MKKNLFYSIIFCILFSANTTLADEWDDFIDIDRAWDGQKTITDKEFNQVVDALEEKDKKKETKKKKKLFKKISGGGTSLHNELDPNNEILSTDIIKSKDDGQLVNVPVNLQLEDGTLEKGYYKVFANKEDDNKIYISFYQSQYYKAHISQNLSQNVLLAIRVFLIFLQLILTIFQHYAFAQQKYVLLSQSNDYIISRFQLLKFQYFA